MNKRAKRKPVEVAWINNTGKDARMFDDAIDTAIKNGGVFGDDLADIFTLSRPAGVWILEMA